MWIVRGRGTSIISERPWTAKRRKEQEVPRVAVEREAELSSEDATQVGSRCRSVPVTNLRRGPLTGSG